MSFLKNSYFSIPSWILFLGIFGFLDLNPTYGQTKHSISGYVSLLSNGEALGNAKIFVASANKGTLTNTYGFYSLTLEAGVYEISFRYTGFPSVVKTVDLSSKDVSLNVELGIKDGEKLIEEVVVNGKRGDNVNSAKLGQMELDIEQIKKLPAFMGEVDVIKTIQLLPGVSSVSEGGQGFYVRGGGPDQNLVLLDEGVVYNAAHLFGFFSVFNSDAVKSVNLIKGGMPANYGGRLSSVLEVNMNEGNNKRFGVKGGLGIISSRLTIEGPLKKDKGSFIVSGRRTYIDVLAKAFIPDSSPFAGSGYYFYDLNAKLNYKLGEKDRIFLSGYYGKDVFTFADKKGGFSADMPWGNGIAAFRWNHVFNSKIFMNVTSTFSDYKFKFGSKQDEFKIEFLSGIQDYGTKVDFSYYPNTKHRIKWGVNYVYHIFTPSSVSASQDTVVFNTGNAQKLFSHEEAIYLMDEFDLNDRFRINAGLRYTLFQHVGPFTRYIKGDISKPDTSIQYGRGDLIKFYHGLEPRVSFRWLTGVHNSIKGGFAYNYQFVHLTSLSAVSLPTDIWYPTTDIAKPQKGFQASLGYFQNFFDDKYEASVEIYYKGMKNMIEFKEGALPSDNVSDNTDNLLVFGQGWAYGIEFFFKKSVGKFTGWIGYTWAKTERKFPDLNGGKVYPAKYDRRHDLTVVGMYTLSDHWSLSGSFIYATGNTLTLPTSWYVQDQNLLYNYGARNSTRMAPYHRLDISATWYDKAYKERTDPATQKVIQVKKKLRNNIAISVYNVYNRANPFFLFVDSDGNLLSGDFKLTVKQVSLFPIIPSVTWNFEF
ncbi:MAG: TonB-dependent receptor [Flavobacteriia bacterium]|nr:TonB-dependent receptor [Flavobacteriia bacterium]NBV90760.1 TonB-dependent receptor [Flavobacteriia bacterium]